VIAFTVHEPSEPSRDILKRADEVVFVKEGTAWLALLFPVLWLLAQRMWLVLAAFIGLTVLLSALVLAMGANQEAAAWASFAPGLLLAVQANDLRRWSIARRGYQMVAAVTARTRDDCEMKFFADFADRLGTARDAAVETARAVAPSAPANTAQNSPGP